MPTVEPRPYDVRKINQRRVTPMLLTPGQVAGFACVVCGVHFPNHTGASEVYGTYPAGKGKRRTVRACTSHGADRLF